MAKGFVRQYFLFRKVIHSIVQVFPYEYQRALKALEAEKQTVAKPEPVKKAEPAVQDIEETIADQEMDKKKVDKILDKTR